ncbi:MAG: NAD-binding protein, partial [Thermotogaceae bacterium]|nr:NAD-binding protein [Thermotogaceae bacterium]
KKLRAIVINGDGSRKYILEEAELMRNDVVVILTPRDHDNLIISQLAKNLFGVERIVSLVNDPENVEIFQKLGINVVLNLTSMITTTIENLMFPEEMEKRFPVEKGISFLTLEITNDSPSLGKKLKDIALPEESIVGAILRGGVLVVPRGETEIRLGDKLFIIASPDVKKDVVKVLVGGNGR